MATFKFLKAIDSGKPIQRFGDGTTSRDFTYIDDIVQGILKCIDATESQNSIHELYNLSSSRPVSLNEFIETCGQVCGAKVIIEEKSSQMGDVDHTYGNLDKAKINLNYKPTFSLLNGLEITLHWIRNNEIRH